MNYDFFKTYHSHIKDIQYGIKKLDPDNKVKVKQLQKALDDVKDLLTDLMADELKG